MNPLPRLRALGPKAKLGLGALALLVLLLALFDWNWLRPPLERYLSHTSGRSVRATDLHLSLDAALRPVVRLRGVRIDNAPWADTQAPFAVAGEARFTFSWPSLLQDVRVVTQLVLVDADIDLQRQADGLRNWRLTRPDDRGPPRMRVLSLEAHNSRLRVVHQGIGLVLQTAATPLAAAEGPLTQRIRFSGRWHEAPLEGEALTGPVLSLQQTGRFFPLRGQVQSGPTVLQLDGEVADLIKLGGVNAKLRLSRGLSDLGGDVRYRHPVGERRSLQATLHSERFALADLPARAGKPPGERLLPQAPLPLDWLGEIDATLDWQVKTLQAGAQTALHELRAHAVLDQGALQLTLKEAALAAGQLSGQLWLDSRARVPSARIELRARALRLDKLLPPPTRVEGPVSGTLALSGQGRSVAAWLASAGGQLSLAMDSGHLSPRLDAALGLNGGKLLRSFFGDDRAVPIRCGALDMQFVNGTGTTRQLVLDTARTRIEGAGRLSLRDETWALRLTPHAHQTRLLRLGGSVVAQGSFTDYRYTVDDARQASTAASGACTAPCASATTAGCG
jgi:uncharacterized protein involved in outer membrane biogenesis